MHLADYIITLVSVRVCVSVHRSVVERLRPQFFTDFHQILHAFFADFRGVQNQILAVSRLWWTYFPTDHYKNLN